MNRPPIINYESARLKPNKVVKFRCFPESEFLCRSALQCLCGAGGRDSRPFRNCYSELQIGSPFSGLSSTNKVAVVVWLCGCVVVVLLLFVLVRQRDDDFVVYSSGLFTGRNYLFGRGVHFGRKLQICRSLFRGLAYSKLLCSWRRFLLHSRLFNRIGASISEESCRSGVLSLVD